MKRGILFLTITMSVFLAACGRKQNDNEEAAKESETDNHVTETIQESEEEYQIYALKYTTVTEGFDWGPAITKIVLNMGETMDGSRLTIDTFSVLSVREYYAANLETFRLNEELTVDTAQRTVTAVYPSDADGNKDETGTYVAIEMEVGPDLTESSPFYFNLITNHNVYVDTSYIVQLAKKDELKTTNGKSVVMTNTNRSGYVGNRNLIAEEFDLTGSYTKDAVTLTYASYIPETASKEKGKNPLLIWLHGVGEAGEDPTIVLLGNKVVNMATDTVQSYFGETGAYILAPQNTTMWMDYDGTATYNNTVEGSDATSYYTETLMGLIKAYVASNPEIDQNRIYIGGCSNGGYMTVNMIINYPDYFAAAYPICEAYSAKWLTTEKIEAIKNIPIWFTHAKTDGTVPIYKGTMDVTTLTYQFETNESGEPIPLDEFTNAIYDRLVKAGAKDVHYSLWDNVVDTSGKYFKQGSTTEPYEYMGHFSWIYALNNECIDQIDGKDVSLFEWLSNQSK